MENPFRYGEAVTGESFTNRKNEIKEITQYIKSGQNVFIFADRRLGKTSLIKTVLQQLSQGREVISAYVDFQQAPSLAEFLEVYSKAISEALISWKEKFIKIAELFTRIIPTFEVTPEGGLKVSFEFSKTRKGIEKALEEVYELPEKVAKKYKKRVVVVFDEFQEVEKYDGDAFEKKLRSFIQHHKDVCYIFTGSKTHLMLDMFSDPKRAFYRSAATYPLNLIPKEDMIKFIVERFNSTKKEISPEYAYEIIKVSQNIPYHVQMLAWNVWNISGDKVKENDLKEAILQVLRNQDELFFNWYDGLSPIQKAVIKALPLTKEIFSRDAIVKYNLGSSSGTQTAIKVLKKNGLVTKSKDGYFIADPFFELWLKKNISGKTL